METDRFWGLIEQARTYAGPAADQAVRDVDVADAGPDHDYWDFDDIDIEAFRDGLAGATEIDDAADAEDADDLDQGDDGDDSDDDDNDGDDDEEDDLTDPVAVALFDLLVKLSAAEIAAFENQFEDLRALADRDDIANAAILIEHGLLGDDSFEDFRAGLVALGRSAYERTLADPDSLAAHPLVREIAGARDPRYLGREDLLYVASHAYAAVTGEEEMTFYEFAESVRDEEAAGPEPLEVADWEVTDEAETRRRLPGLADLFFDRSMHVRERAMAKLGLRE
jgi:hypothetical protein